MDLLRDYLRYRLQPTESVHTVGAPRLIPDERASERARYVRSILASGVLLIVVENRNLIRLSVEKPLAFLARGNHRPGLKAFASHFDRHRGVGDQVVEPSRIGG